MRFRFGPGFSVRFEGLPEALADRIAHSLEHVPVTDGPEEGSVLVSLGEAGPNPSGEEIVAEPPLSVLRDGASLYFVLPGIEVRCQAERGVAGVRLSREVDAELDQFVALVLAPLLVELAVSRGWLGIHAASVAIDGQGILLPAPSGAGKSTLFTNVHRAGHGVLSDDLTWLYPDGEGWRLRAFPRAAAVCSPTIDDVPLCAVVCPEIVRAEENVIEPLPRAELIGKLLGQCGFLSAGAAAAARFGLCTRVGRSVPGYRLAAGSRRDEVPYLLEEVARPRVRQASR